MPLTIDIVVPVYNEEQALPRSILILTDYLRSNVINPWQIIIADNASTDSTRSVSEMLCERYPGVNYLYLPQKGRGRALKAAWMESTADIVCYMDVDLSTDLVHLPQLINSIESGSVTSQAITLTRLPVFIWLTSPATTSPWLGESSAMVMLLPSAAKA